MLHERYGFPVICSLHPRTRSKVKQFGVRFDRPGLRFVEPIGFFDFVRLEQSAFCVLTDSGTVQEETCILGVPNVTLRDVTERPETIECGSNVLAGCDAPDDLEYGGAGDAARQNLAAARGIFAAWSGKHGGTRVAGRARGHRHRRFSGF